MMLCHLCAKLFATKEDLRVLISRGPDGLIGVKRNYHEISQLSREGCSLCRLMLQVTEPELARLRFDEAVYILLEANLSYETILMPED
jgi:hypothetical protein